MELTNNRDIGQLQWAPYSRMFMILRWLILRDRVKIANLLLPSTEASDLHYEKKNLCSSRGLFEKKCPNFIRTIGRHPDNLMYWLVRLGSIK